MADQISVKPERIRVLKIGRTERGPVYYWMSRDQRAYDNWALLYACRLAQQERLPVIVIFNLVDAFERAARRHYRFMLYGLRETEAALREYQIPLLLLRGDPPDAISALLRESGAHSLVTDFDPLRIKRQWKKELLQRLSCPVYEVDAHNVVPCFAASPKQEFGAFILRLKLNRLLPFFLDEFPLPPRQKFKMAEAVDWKGMLESPPGTEPELSLDEPIPGSREAKKKLTHFLREKIHFYASGKNDPSRDFSSGISPYLHFGQLSAQRAVLETKRSGNWPEFLEELVTRRELSDNYCFYNAGYDSIEGFPDWARKTLDHHREDSRPFLYSLEELEAGRSHDEIWNAAQLEMVLTGRMHGYMRMYWAKKILEWSATPEEALLKAIALNDRYELDGRDPNGYAGCAWAIGGVHDRPFGERPVFGKIRYMNAAGLRRKFSISRYLERIDGLREAAKNQF